MIICTWLVAAIETLLRTKENKPTEKKKRKTIQNNEKWKPFQTHLVFTKTICKNGIRNLANTLKKEKFIKNYNLKLRIFTV